MIVVPVVPVVPGTVDGRDVRFWAGGAFTGGFSGDLMETQKRRGREFQTDTRRLGLSSHPKDRENNAHFD